MTVFYSVLALISLMNLFFILIFLLKRVFGLNSISTLRYMPHFLRLIVIFITLFYWALMIPILELYSNVLDCSVFDPFFFPIKIISILALIRTAFSAFWYLWANRSYNFLQANLLRIKFHTIELIITSLTIILIVFFKKMFF